MTRTNRSQTIAPASSRPVPPLPHPSWTYGSSLPTENASRLAPDEFWKRLGI